ncbi:hypothetical protein [Bacillus toyonensis]|uniref:hypothetical protein n=1 Tax=Bacillus toyonensis TaxID=155322 RepID=UPI000BFB5749|nr:hypothetical protein [Bacillus toyonensis]PHB28881.1 hypothetical protein COE88_02605 [Bacillus toyonensis]
MSNKKRGFFYELYDKLRNGEDAVEKLSIISSLFTILGVSLGVVLAQIFVYIKFEIEFVLGLSFTLFVIAFAIVILYLFSIGFKFIRNESWHVAFKAAGILALLASLGLVLVFFWEILGIIYQMTFK